MGFASVLPFLGRWHIRDYFRIEPFKVHASAYVVMAGRATLHLVAQPCVDIDGLEVVSLAVSTCAQRSWVVRRRWRGLRLVVRIHAFPKVLLRFELH
jgi:hypothetical protein